MSAALRHRRYPFRGGRARPPRILIARPDHLGDVLLTLPAASTIRRAIPGAHVAFLVRPDAAAVPRHCPDVSETLTAPYPSPSADFDREAWQGPAAVVARVVARGRFDVAILARPADSWSGAILVAAGGSPPHRVCRSRHTPLPHRGGPARGWSARGGGGGCPGDAGAGCAGCPATDRPSAGCAPSLAGDAERHRRGGSGAGTCGRSHR